MPLTLRGDLRWQAALGLLELLVGVMEVALLRLDCAEMRLKFLELVLRLERLGDRRLLG